MVQRERTATCHPGPGPSTGTNTSNGNGTNNNISWRDLINETWVSLPLAEPKVIPSDEELFGDVIGQLG